MIDEIKEYFSDLYGCNAFAEIVLPPLMYSAITKKWIYLENTSPVRYRLNILFSWGFGFFKSTILKQVAAWCPFESSLVTTATSAALRGSFKDGEFYPPEFLINDLVVIPEFGGFAGDDAVYGTMLTALEEGDVRISLVKGGNITDREKERMKSYGANYNDGRIEYRNKALVWAATHSIDGLNPRMREALLSRFFVIFVPPEDIPGDVAFRDPYMLQQSDVEIKASNWLDNLLKKNTKPDHIFAGKVINIFAAEIKESEQTVLPREVGDIRRMVLAHHDMFPSDTVDVVVGIIRPFLTNTSSGKQTTREKIVNLIYQNPLGIDEIHNITGFTKAAVFGHLNRTRAKRIGTRPVKYYLDSAPSKVKTKKKKELKTKNE